MTENHLVTRTQLLSTSQAAQLAQIAPSTIKRWADEGRLAAVRTAGGHRRFRRADVEQLVRGSQFDSKLSSPHDLIIEKLVHGRRHEIDGALLEARDRLGAWYRVADELGSMLRELGVRWARGSITVAEEHAASHHLQRALARIADSMPIRFGSVPRCVLACPGDDEHTLGLALAELCLREAGWAPFWLGQRTPASELASLIETQFFEMVALSASTYSNQSNELQQTADLVGRACLARDTKLVLGGTGNWPDPSSFGRRVTTFANFYAYLMEANTA